MELRNTFYFQVAVREEQKRTARQLVEFSLQRHTVANIWDKHPAKLGQTRLLRYVGSLGEIVFADLYQLPRPTRSFGAADGQDWGQDFALELEGGQTLRLDIKSMKRQSGALSAHYVLNIPASQLHKPNARTTHYCCISFHQSEQSGTVASVLGLVNKHEIEKGEIGTLYTAGTRRIRADQTYFVFQEDTYEVLFGDIQSPLLTDRIRRWEGFTLRTLRNT